MAPRSNYRRLPSAGKKCILAAVLLCSPLRAETTCSYRTFSWDTKTRTAVDPVTVIKPYTELTESEIDRFTGCSVCEQDQREISIPPLAPFKVCRLLATRLEHVLRKLIEQGYPIRKIIGYRVGKTRGDADGRGLRTRFSNHSYGIAIDINPDNNGLYDNCPAFAPDCRLIRGGHWNPERPESLRADDEIVSELEAIGLKWGGEIAGRQKDFMHFSPTGY